MRKLICAVLAVSFISTDIQADAISTHDFIGVWSITGNSENTRSGESKLCQFNGVKIQLPRTNIIETATALKTVVNSGNLVLEISGNYEDGKSKINCGGGSDLWKTGGYIVFDGRLGNRTAYIFLDADHDASKKIFLEGGGSVKSVSNTETNGRTKEKLRITGIHDGDITFQREQKR